MNNTKLQGIMAVLSFASGVIIACVCLFAVEPYGEIDNSAITVVSELLILAGTLLGAKVYFDTSIGRFSERIKKLESEK